jgi:DNA-binding protein HU-beta
LEKAGKEIMTKSQVRDKIADTAELPSKAAAGQALDAILDSLAEVLAAGDSVSLTGFGSFSVAQRAARDGRNPRTGEPLRIPAAKVVKFSPGKHLKIAVN